MRIIPKNTAILVFANSATEEAKHKAIPEGNLLFEHFNTAILKKVKKTGVPHFLYTEKEQEGKTFGQRFSNAIQDVFNQGFEQVITIGNDTPLLTVADIHDAITALNTADSVIGPSVDGGAYLIGLKKIHFKAKLFAQLPWQTKKLRASLNATMTTKGLRIAFLKYLNDVNSYQDLKRLIPILHQLTTTLRQFILTIVSLSAVSKYHLVLWISIYYQSVYYNKGSPAGYLTAYRVH